MQNIDYSRKLNINSKRKNFESSIRSHQSSLHHSNVSKNNNSLKNIINNTNNLSHSILYLFIGGILLFTAGIVVGLKINQRETLFTQNEINSFRNVGKNNSKIVQSEEIDPSDEPATTTTKSIIQDSSDKNSLVPSIPSGLKYPPKMSSVNYIIQLGTFTQEDAGRYGKSLMKEKQDFQGRVFRTSTGKLYLGYYYDRHEANDVLKEIRRFRNGIFEEASIKVIEF